MKNMATVVAVLMFAGGAGSAAAAPVINISSEGFSAAQAAEAAFLGNLNAGYITETFDSGYTVGAQSPTITSLAGVGSFTMDLAGTGGACDTSPYSCSAGLAVLDSSSSPYSGRFDISPDNWLDSMDAQEMTISPSGGYTAMGFYMTDPNDAGGRFSIGGMNFSFSDIFGSALGNGKVFYISLYDDSGLGDLSIYSNHSNDGYGLDNVTVGTVPEPGTLALMGLGLVGLVLIRSKKNKA
ncbi:PEP-CTERM sorting domain-containing protein [Marinobacter sp.]|uniref:PEP-CTERM sorting domain-containing protein n=1 Tax=Marinobacter sp. TaxID=50741 RepID=UPI002B27402C|nr:PEP-CTERM sorting domain-containing protein [Marinobacter sp.]